MSYIPKMDDWPNIDDYVGGGGYYGTDNNSCYFVVDPIQADMIESIRSENMAEALITEHSNMIFLHCETL